MTATRQQLADMQLEDQNRNIERGLEELWRTMDYRMRYSDYIGGYNPLTGMSNLAEAERLIERLNKIVLIPKCENPLDDCLHEDCEYEGASV